MSENGPWFNGPRHVILDKLHTRYLPGIYPHRKPDRVSGGRSFTCRRSVRREESWGPCGKVVHDELCTHPGGDGERKGHGCHERYQTDRIQDRYEAWDNLSWLLSPLLLQNLRTLKVLCITIFLFLCHSLNLLSRILHTYKLLLVSWLVWLIYWLYVTVNNISVIFVRAHWWAGFWLVKVCMGFGHEIFADTCVYWFWGQKGKAKVI